ncbi:hypothetical protein [Novosphingobium sp. Chol11]|uniref:hypothetical protein n=1 Tax=Novosphingobium sp. Chol11 TaxID=1385763 RepID=UPI0025D67DB5|nr:hypothetical protein [Novosphingobium sp. Chol11]
MALPASSRTKRLTSDLNSLRDACGWRDIVNRSFSTGPGAARAVLAKKKDARNSALQFA